MRPKIIKMIRDISTVRDLTLIDALELIIETAHPLLMESKR